MKPLLPPPPPPASSPLLSLPSLTPYPPPWECRGLLRLGHSLLSPLSVSLPVSVLFLPGSVEGWQGRAEKEKRKKRVCDGLGRKLTHTKKQEKMPRNAARNAHTHGEKSFFFS